MLFSDVPNGRLILLALTVAALLGFPPTTRAQSVDATVVGRVIDEQARVVAAATVTVTNEETNESRAAKSSGEGLFTVTHLPPGRYRVSVEAAGFRPFTETGVVLETAETRRLTAPLRVGGVTDQVTVIAPLARMNTDTMLKGELVSTRLVSELPLNGRNYLDLAVLAPGVYHRVSPDEQGDGLSASGARADSVNVTLDGFADRADRNATPGLNVPLDAVREFDVRTSTYPSDTGRTGGAQMAVVTKSGTNRLSGSGAFYLRDGALDARNPFLPADQEPNLQRRQGGGTIGGPLVHDRVFVYGAYEHLHERRTLSANSTAPNEAWLNGDFRNVRGAGADGIWGNADDTNRILDPLTKKEFSTPNVIPTSMFDAAARQMVAFLPAANIAGTLDGYAAAGRSSDDRHTALTRVDANLSSTMRVSGRWSGSWDDSFDPFPSQRNYYPGFGRTAALAQQLAGVSINWVIGSRWTNETRLGYFQQNQDTAGQQSGTDYLTQFGLPASTTSPQYWGFPSVRIDGYAEFGDRPNDPSSYTVANMQFADVATWAGGRHTVRAGVEVIASRYDELDVRNIRGDFRFRGRATNTLNQTSSGFRSFADFLLGYADQTQRQIGAEPARLRGKQVGLFLHDEWRLSNAVTVSAGLRYDRQTPLSEASNHLSNFIPSLGQVVLAGDPAFPPALVTLDSGNVAPRAGFAYRPFGNDRTTVRASGGIYYSLEGFNVTRQQLAVSYPFIVREQYARLGNDPRSLSFANPYPPAQASVQGVNTPLGMATDFQSPEYYHYNATLERQLGRDLVLEAGYVGSQGRHLGRRYNLNQPIPVVGSDGKISSVRPYPVFGDIQYQDQTINSSYNAFEVSLRRRLANGITLLAAYTLSGATDTGSVSTGNLSNVSTTGSQKTPQNIYDMGAERGSSDFNRTHQFSAAFAWDLPFGRGRRYLSTAPSAVAAVVGGWQLSGIVTLLSGRPFTPQYSAGDFAAQRPDLVGDPYTAIPDGLAFNPAAFVKPQASTSNPGAYGSSGRNILTGPGYRNVDLALARSIPLGGSFRLQLRAEVFNAFNTVNYQLPVFLLDRSDVGRYTATANEAREWQLAIRLNF